MPSSSTSHTIAVFIDESYDCRLHRRVMRCHTACGPWGGAAWDGDAPGGGATPTGCRTLLRLNNGRGSSRARVLDMPNGDLRIEPIARDPYHIERTHPLSVPTGALSSPPSRASHSKRSCASVWLMRWSHADRADRDERLTPKDTHSGTGKTRRHACALRRGVLPGGGEVCKL